MENWENVEKATLSATNSLGSANEENLKYLESIEGRTKQLASSVQVFWKNLINSDTIKFLVSSLNKVVDTMDMLINNSFSKFIMSTGLVTVAIALLNKGIVALGATSFGTAVGVLALNVAQGGLLVTTKALTTAMLASPLFKVALIVGAIGAIIKVADHLNTTLKEQKEIVATLSGELDVLQSEYSKLSSVEYKTDEQKLYLSLLEAEIKAKEKLLKIEKQSEVEKEFFTQKSNSQYNYKTSGADKINKNIEDLKRLREEIKNAPDLKSYNKIDKQIQDITISLTESFKTIQDGIDVLGDNAPQGLKDLSDAISDVVIESSELDDVVSSSANAFAKYYDEVERGISLFDESELSQEKLTKIIEDSVSNYEDITTSLQTYNKLLAESQTKEGLSAQSKQDIITKHQELLPYINDEKELRKQLIAIIEREEKVQKQAYINMLMYSEDFYNAKVKGNKDLVTKLGEYYDKDLENAKSLAEAKAKVEEKLITHIAKQWAKFYQVSAIAGEGYVQTMGQGGLIDVQGQNMAKNLSSEMRKVSGLFDGIVASFGLPDFKAINMSGVKDGKSSSKSTADQRKFLESIDAEIRAIKLKNDALLATEKSLQEQLKLAKDMGGAEGLAEQYRITGELIKHNEEALKSFKLEQDLVHKRANEIRAQNSKYNTENWFDSEGEQTVAYIEQYNKATKDQQAEMETLFGLIQKLKKAWGESAGEVSKIVDANKQLVSEQQKLIEQQRELARTNWIKEQNKALQEQRDRLQSLESIQEAIVAIIRKRGEEEKRQLDENHNAEMSSLDERHNERKKKYAEELDAFKKLIQDKIDALDEQYEEEDYLEQLTKERAEATRLQGEIDVLSLDDSLTARNKTIELRKQLADQNEKIAKMQQKKERDTLKKSLQDQLKDREKEASDKDKIADKTYENEKKRLEEDYKISKEYLDKKYADDKVYAEAKEAIMRGTVETTKGHFEDIYSAYQDFEDKFGKGMGILGNIIKKDFLDQLEKAQQAVKDLEYLSRPRDDYDSDYQPGKDDGYNDPYPDKPSSGGGNSGSSGGIYMSSSDFSQYRAYKMLYEAAQRSGDRKTMDETHRLANAIRKKYGITNDKYSFDDLKNKSYKDVGFNLGGKVTQDGLAMVHGNKDPEWIMRDFHLQKIIADSVLSTIKIAIPKIPSGIQGRQQVIIDVKNLLNIEGNVDKNIIPQIQKEGNNIINELQKLGNFRPIKI